MTVDRVLDRQFGERLNFADEFLDRRRSKEGVEDQNAIIADHETGITRSQAARFGNRGVNSIGDLNQLKVVFGFRRRGLRMVFGIDERDRHQRDHAYGGD